MENDGLKSEVLWVSKLDCARIIPTAEKKIEKERVARSLTQPIMDAQRQVIIFSHLRSLDRSDHELL